MNDRKTNARRTKEPAAVFVIVLSIRTSVLTLCYDISRGQRERYRVLPRVYREYYSRHANSRGPRDALLRFVGKAAAYSHVRIDSRRTMTRACISKSTHCPLVVSLSLSDPGGIFTVALRATIYGLVNTLRNASSRAIKS